MYMAVTNSDGQVVVWLDDKSPAEMLEQYEQQVLVHGKDNVMLFSRVYVTAAVRVQFMDMCQAKQFSLETTRFAPKKGGD